MYMPCTTSPARQRRGVALLLLCVASEAWAQGKMPPEAVDRLRAARGPSSWRHPNSSVC
jgi:hypothetical protein